VYELVLGAVGKLGFDLYRTAQFLSLAATATTLALWWRWTAGRFGRGAGWIAALCIATNPTIVRYGYSASTDALYVALPSASFVTLFAPRPTRRHAVLAGVFAAAATLTRYTGIVLVPLGFVAILWPGKGSAWRGHRLAGAGLFAIGVFALFGPWWAFTLTR